jgi:hypothetical protein
MALTSRRCIQIFVIPGGHFRLIEMRVAPPGALHLNLARADDAAVDFGAGLSGWRVGAQSGGRQARDFDKQVDAFEQRPRNLAAIALDRFGVVATSPRRIASPVARAERRCFLPYVQIRRKSLIQKAWGFEPKTLGAHSAVAGSCSLSPKRKQLRTSG